MGIENVEEMTSEGGRESSQAERDRHDEEIAAENKARQIRLGHIPNPMKLRKRKQKKRSLRQRRQLRARSLNRG